MTDVFLSYKAEDRARVAPLVAALESDGLSVWWDAHIGGGDDWRGTIQRHLDAARCVIVAWSKRSVGPNGQFVRDEASRAQRRGVYLPVRIDQVQPPLGFGETQSLPLNGWKGNLDDPRYQALLAAVRLTLGIEAQASTSTLRASGISRRKLVASAAFAAVATGGVGVWWLIRPVGTVSDSIAVLPFANLSGDPAQAYFSDGIAEELRSTLSRIAGLKVVARTSSEAMRDADAKLVADKLGVANILSGSVRRSPTMIRISAQLVDGKNGLERWSQAYDRPAGDSLQIQSDIAGQVARALEIHLGGADRQRLTAGGTTNPVARDLLLQARATNADVEGEASLRRSIAMVDSALALDPRYAEAVAAKATMLAELTWYVRSAAQSQASYRLAATVARRAIQLAPEFGDGHGALASILRLQLLLKAAFAQFAKMRTLPVSNGATLPQYAVFLSQMGRHRQALKLIDEAAAIDPLNVRVFLVKGGILRNARQYSQALDAAQQAIALQPDATWPRAHHAFAQMLLGRNSVARAELNGLKGQQPDLVGLKAVCAARQGDVTGSNRLLLALAGDAFLVQQAQVLAQQGLPDKAIAALNKAWVARNPGLANLLVDPLFDSLRSDPRFKALVQRLDFP